MQIRVGLETAFEGRMLGQALDFPAVFAYGADEAEVVLRLPHALLDFDYWVRNHTDEPWFHLGDLDFRLVEVFRTYQVGDYEVNAFFEDDRRPLSADEIAQALLVHQWQREELLAGIETLPPDLLTQLLPGQRWPILGILGHIAGVEAWYLSHLDLVLPEFDRNADPIENLARTFEHVQASLPLLVDVNNVVEGGRELWSPRKVVRWLLWHQRDHIGHIQQLAGLRGD